MGNLNERPIFRRLLKIVHRSCRRQEGLLKDTVPPAAVTSLTIMGLRDDIAAFLSHQRYLLGSPIDRVIDLVQGGFRRNHFDAVDRGNSVAADSMCCCCFCCAGVRVLIQANFYDKSTYDST